jgi:clan AA aspartic protease (TIGR02281 family)
MTHYPRAGPGGVLEACEAYQQNVNLQSSVNRQAPTQLGQDKRTAAGIAMRNMGGTYVVPVVINDAITLNFIIDSGAADVSIPADVVLTLVRTGTLSRADFLGTKTYVLADGSQIPSEIFRIRSLKVGDQTIMNVTASVGSVKSPLLLGQSFLERFRSWSVDNKEHLLILKDRN